MIDDYLSCTVGIGGHFSITEGSSVKIIKQLKQFQQEFSGCPINYNTPTGMPEATFRRTCLAFQKRAGLMQKNGSKKGSEIVGGYFKSKNKYLCSRCTTGKCVRDQKRIIELPKGITLIKPEAPPKKLKRRKL